MSSSSAAYLTDWRNTFSLVRNNLQGSGCKIGNTFRGSNAHVEMPFNSNNACVTAAVASGGTAKPGPTTDTSSRIARLKKLQTRTRSTNVSVQRNGGTRRGAIPTVENSTWGVSEKSARAQLFGTPNRYDIPQSTSGRGGDSSQLIYFKNVFARISLNNTESKGTGDVVDDN